jgi:hypothetical protein
MMSIVPHVIKFPQVPALVLLAISNVFCIVAAGLVVGAVRDQLSRSETQVQRYAWQMRQLAPEHPAIADR